MISLNFPIPTDITEVRRFLGLFNQVANFIENVSEETAPIMSLLHKNSQFLSGPEQAQCFDRLKRLLTSDNMLAYYDPKSPTRVETDASAHRLGVALFQEVQGVWKPVSYASRSMPETEKRYAVIEKDIGII